MRQTLRERLGRSYSGIRAGTTKFDITIARLRTNQIFVVGEALQPGAYQLASVATVLNALYAAGGPSDRGNFRRIEVRRLGSLINTAAESGDEWIEFDSVINIRPSLGNRSRGVEDAGRWNSMSLAEQLANVGSEVDRAIRAWETQRSGRFEGALARALELFDLTAADARWRGARCREILRWREEFCRLFFDRDAPEGSARGPREYFLRFGVLARRDR
ncbi:MAG: SLBB domain-containing protein [Gemmatimonadetes bacterium]|nr:SLBB domain-containing protein [Gemmatimonadota bacterium]